jgi:CheY-like chemotaxis protein
MRSLKCLVVEDDENWQRAFTSALVKRDFAIADIRIVADKALALVELDAWDPDLVILDLGIDAAKGRGDVHQRHGRHVLTHIGHLNRQRTFRMMVLVISGHVDEYDQQMFENDPCVVRAVNKADISDALPSFIKRAKKYCLPVYRDLKNHWPQMYGKFEKVMNDQTSSADALFAAYDIARDVLENLGQKIMGANYPCTPTEDDFFNSIEVLRGNDNNISSRVTIMVAPECWIAGIIHEHFHTIRRYCNSYRHAKKLKPGAAYKMPLDTQQDAEIITSLENFERATHVVRAAVTDILEWYLPWHIRNLSSAVARPTVPPRHSQG